RALLTQDFDPQNSESMSIWGAINVFANQYEIAGPVTVSNATAGMAQRLEQIGGEILKEMINVDKTLGLISEPLKAGEKPDQNALNLKAIGFKMKLDPEFDVSQILDDGPGRIPSLRELEQKRDAIISARSALIQYLNNSGEFFKQMGEVK